MFLKYFLSSRAGDTNPNPAHEGMGRFEVPLTNYGGEDEDGDDDDDDGDEDDEDDDDDDDEQDEEGSLSYCDAQLLHH